MHQRLPAKGRQLQLRRLSRSRISPDMGAMARAAVWRAGGRAGRRGVGPRDKGRQGPTVMPSTQALARLTVELRSLALTTNFKVTVLFA